MTAKVDDKVVDVQQTLLSKMKEAESILWMKEGAAAGRRSVARPHSGELFAPFAASNSSTGTRQSCIIDDV